MGMEAPWKFLPCSGCCFTCTCANCTPSGIPCEITVEIDGFGHVDDDCADCADLNGIYVLTWYGECRWGYTRPSQICDSTWIDCWVTSSDLIVVVTHFFATDFYKQYEPGVGDCNAWDEEELDPNDDYGQCRVGGATCKVTFGT